MTYLRDDPATVRRDAEACARGTERWPGDPYPAALVEHLVTKAAEADAWQAVATAAQHQANACESVPTRIRPPGFLTPLLATAAAHRAPAKAASRALRAAEHAEPPSGAS